jgi:hypothetical protein
VVEDELGEAREESEGVGDLGRVPDGFEMDCEESR